MNGVASRAYCLLSDHAAVWQFMLDIYEKDWRNGVPAPFLEYALCSEWMDLSCTHRWRLWQRGGEIVAFCFNENPVTDVYCSLRPGHEELAADMVSYARARMPGDGNTPGIQGRQRLNLFGGQRALLDAARKLGYRKTGGFTDCVHLFDKPLDYKLPPGFRIVPSSEITPEKAALCCYKGFNHEKDGPWDGDAENCHRLLTAPHQTMQYAVAIADKSGDYACWAGMWWTPQNKLAYMEPLCTVPEHRRKGLAAAALSELYRRMQPLGATHMTGGANAFYPRIGYTPMIEHTMWEKG